FSSVSALDRSLAQSRKLRTPSDKIEPLAARHHWHGLEFTAHGGRHLFLDERDRADEWLIEQCDTDASADTDVVVSLKYRVNVLRSDHCSHVGVVTQRCRSAAHRLNRANHGAQINLTGG